jgi:hypothetical protein
MTVKAQTRVEYLTSPNRVMSAADGTDYAYRDLGEGAPPLVLLQHFRGNLDNWDPALIDALAAWVISDFGAGQCARSRPG